MPPSGTGRSPIAYLSHNEHDLAGWGETPLAIFRQLGDRRTEAGILLQLGHAQKTIGQADAARQSWQQALDMFEELGDTRADLVRTQLGAEASTITNRTG